MKNLIFALLVLISAGCATGTENKTKMSNTNDATVVLTTTLGDITIRLYGDTPKHRDNFLKLVSEGYYDGVLFHRVIDKFMIQTGDPDSKNAPAGKMLGMGDPGYTIDAEIMYPKHFHRRGALAAARTGDEVNPERKSSGSQFYIVTGQVYNDSTIVQMEKRMQQSQQQEVFNRLAKEYRDTIFAMRKSRDRAGLEKLQNELIEQTMKEVAANPAKISAEAREAYTSVGGTPHLDGAYTVFGEVVDGMEVVAKIENAETDRNDRPVTDIKIIKAVIKE
ncbi:MAG: peptidylprolyl isomerase [Muribaculaceae bacterium]